MRRRRGQEETDGESEGGRTHRRLERCIGSPHAVLSGPPHAFLVVSLWRRVARQEWRRLTAQGHTQHRQTHRRMGQRTGTSPPRCMPFWCIALCPLRASRMLPFAWNFLTVRCIHAMPSVPSPDDLGDFLVPLVHAVRQPLAPAASSAPASNAERGVSPSQPSASANPALPQPAALHLDAASAAHVFQLIGRYPQVSWPTSRPQNLAHRLSKHPHAARSPELSSDLGFPVPPVQSYQSLPRSGPIW